MALVYRSFAQARIEGPTTAWTVTLQRRMDDALPAPTVVQVPAGTDAEVGWGDMKAGTSGSDALPAFSPSFVSLVVLDLTGAILSNLVAVKNAGEPIRTLKLILEEDLDADGSHGGPFAPAAGFSAARKWEGFVRPETLSVELFETAAGRRVQFYAFDGLDRAAELGVIPWAATWSGIMNWNSVHGAFSRLLYAEDAVAGPGLLQRPILYALALEPKVPKPATGATTTDPPTGQSWVERTFFRWQAKEDGVDPRKTADLASDPRYNEPVDVGLAAESMAFAMFARVFQDWDGWKVAGVQLIGEGTTGADAFARFFHKFTGPLSGQPVGRMNEVTAADDGATFAVSARRATLALDQFDRKSRLYFLAPITRLVGITKREETWSAETGDLENAWSLAVNPHAKSEQAADGSAYGVQGWTGVGTINVLGDNSLELASNGAAISQELTNVDGTGRENEASTSSGAVEGRAQFAAARLKVGIVLTSGTVNTQNIQVRFALAPDDGGPTIYARNDGTWGTTDQGIRLSLPAGPIGGAYTDSTVQVVLATPIPKAGVITASLVQAAGNQRTKVYRFSPHVGDRSGNPFADFRSSWSVWDVAGVGTGTGTRRPGQIGSAPMNLRRLGPNRRNVDYLTPYASIQYGPFTGSGSTVTAGYPLVVYVTGWKYLAANGTVGSKQDITGVYAAAFLELFGRLARQIEGTVRSAILTPGDAFALTITNEDGTTETVDWIVAASRVRLRTETSKVVAVERPRFTS